ncbi:MAG: U exon [psittacine adenovirus 7]|uniref:U exon n=1 Tax=psittacine adenovirus 7 TaxID=2848040 RepID=A0A6B9LRF1_9ADEN|nr:MAG: U exon [psittacine adenovirus 7]QHB43571.1 MAG: U exon [psittacine adenovirus 7]
MGSFCCKPKRINSVWFPSSEIIIEDVCDGVDGVGVEPASESKSAQTESRISATQLLCQTCLYWLIRYCIQNSDLILQSLFPTIHDQVDGRQAQVQT